MCIIHKEKIQLVKERDEEIQLLHNQLALFQSEKKGMYCMSWCK